MSASWRILEGDCRNVLRSLPERSVHTCVTSPPYFGLRDYNAPGQLGLELTPAEYVAALVDVFRDVRRVLRDDGTVWLNLGDSYAGSWGNYGNRPEMDGKSLGQREKRTDFLPRGAYEDHRARPAASRPLPGIKPKDLLGNPWLVAFALRADGWFLRSDIIWSKPNPMPESVTDRPTKAHEYVFLLSKGPRYFYDADAIREPASQPEGVAALTGQHKTLAESMGTNGDGASTLGTNQGASHRNKRSVWNFATFPPKLIEPCVLAGAPERACGECGAPWVRVVEHGEVQSTGGSATGARATNMGTVSPLGQDPDSGAFNTGAFVQREHVTLGFEPSCSHGDGSAAGVVLDPFAGSGTSGMVALRHGRSFVGIELSPTYAAMARDRIIGDAPLLNQPAELVA